MWYHLASYDLILAARALSAAGYCCIGFPMGLLIRLTYHIPYLDDMLPSITVIPYLTTLRLVAVKVAMQTSSHSCPIDIRASDCSWGEI